MRGGAGGGVFEPVWLDTLVGVWNDGWEPVLSTKQPQNIKFAKKKEFLNALIFITERAYIDVTSVIEILQFTDTRASMA